MKPPYRIPSVTEIDALPWNGLNVVSTFAGAGGSSLGYRMAGYKVLWVNEFIGAALDTYRANACPWTVLDGRDVREVTAAEILSATGLSVGELDLLDGSPPCSPFSKAARRGPGHWNEESVYSSTTQRSDDLFFEFTRLLNDLQPKMFVAENVEALTQGKAVGYFQQIWRAMEACGYSVEARILDAQWLGVPQVRRRIVFIGRRQDLSTVTESVFPEPLKYRYSIDEACPNILEEGYKAVRVDSEGVFKLQQVELDQPLPTVTVQRKAHFWLESDPSDQRSSTARRALGDVDEGRRRLTIPELKLLSSFPADYVLTGSYSQQWERVARSVPPFMAEAVASKVARALQPEMSKGNR